MIHKTRVLPLNERDDRRGAYVLYWMQQSQRPSFNPALEYGIASANARGLPIVVGFGLMDDYPDANLRHYAFMLQGLREVARTLAERGVGFVIRHGRAPEVALDLAADAALLVCDCGWTTEHAYRTTLHLNNKYFLDGRDPNSFANVAWIFGLHDRPWAERPVFGKVRYMNANGLRRKFDMDAYIDAVDKLVAAEKG